MVLSWSRCPGSALTPGSCNSWSFPQAAAPAAVAGELPWDVLGCSVPLDPALLSYTNILCKKPRAEPLPGVQQHQHTQGHAALASCAIHPLTTGSAGIPRTFAAPHELCPCGFPHTEPAGLSLTPYSQQMFSPQLLRIPRAKQMSCLPFRTSQKPRGVWHSSRGVQDNPLWLPPLLAEISLQGTSCVVTWPPVFHPL